MTIEEAMRLMGCATQSDLADKLGIRAQAVAYWRTKKGCTGQVAGDLPAERAEQVRKMIGGE